MANLQSEKKEMLVFFGTQLLLVKYPICTCSLDIERIKVLLFWDKFLYGCSRYTEMHILFSQIAKFSWGGPPDLPLPNAWGLLPTQNFSPSTSNFRENPVAQAAPYLHHVNNRSRINRVIPLISTQIWSLTFKYLE